MKHVQKHNDCAFKAPNKYLRSRIAHETIANCRNGYLFSENIVKKNLKAEKACTESCKNLILGVLKKIND